MQQRQQDDPGQHLNLIQQLEVTPGAEAHHPVRSMDYGQPGRTQHPSDIRPTEASSPGVAVLHSESQSQPSRSTGDGGGILSQLRRLYSSHAAKSPRPGSSINSDSATNTLETSSSTKPSIKDSLSLSVPASVAAPSRANNRWHGEPRPRSPLSLVNTYDRVSLDNLPPTTPTPSRPGKKQRKSNGKTYSKKEEVHITVLHHYYIIRLCHALMKYGAPTHRLEESLQRTAHALGVPAQVLYLPGCMMISFGDPTTHTAKVKLARTVQGVDLGRLADSHNIYNHVIHGAISVEEAAQELDQVISREPRFNQWILILIYGLASATVGPFAFGARPMDMLMSFLLGALVGFMQHILVPRSVLYAKVFQVSAALLTSFLARALGSVRITRNGSQELLFCFSALAQSSLALILPGLMVLYSSLELQAHQIVAGSVHMVYAIIDSLFLGYGLAVGITLYGFLDSNASSELACYDRDIYGPVNVWKFPCVAIYAALLALANQGKWKQLPVMVFIALTGYITNSFSTAKLGSQSEVANTVGALTVGVLGNLYSRVWHEAAATVVLPGVFVLVASGLASSGSLLSGLQCANEVRHNLQTSGNRTEQTASSDISVSGIGFGMVQVAIGTTVGLFMATLVVYPYGKKRTGIFSF
ncbi:hypothetical protein N7492_009739 [Penicillium capsulatum]|uniref:DUF1212 domain membrane protein n=1 Tax=Penicillium capsulatum TaxID=69766 RepID=A0A9W9HKR0_9EURO|nr:hypothetical protein N7492_010724 [Penicillium capsulatum]KAJ5152459.1 hypothetical protein N7492_009739 [Penicillium capsulatum]KAJ6114057.1 hypothetical protein N7512_007502 [Penicillium capsulatum]KAJ6114178.1 hypothetical protein N7512_007623 [Penicillium capsulatum]